MFRRVLFAAVLAAASPAAADEGMWTFDNFPVDRVRAKYGVEVDQAFLDRVRGAGVRLSTGCSAGVVSPQGLVLSNHHCISDCVQTMSTAARDYLAQGFVAGTRAEERRCAGMQAEILVGVADVSERVARAHEGKPAREYMNARNAEVALLESSACAGRERTHRCQVVTLYQGGQYRLYTFRRYDDVRVVLAPEFKLAMFGGDPDNYNFPRYNFDFSFLRLYENGRPAVTPTHLGWSTVAPRTGEPVFVVGNPGNSQRLLTADDLQSLRDVALPLQQVLRAELRGRLVRFSQEDPEQARIATQDLFYLENIFKRVQGQVQALSGPGFLASKRAADEALRAQAVGRTTGDPWAEIAAAQDDFRALYPLLLLVEAEAGSLSELFDYARLLVRAAAERPKPNGERLPQFGDARLPRLVQELMEVRPISTELETLHLEFWLSKVREHLGPDAVETQRILGDQSPESLAARLAASRLGDPAVRRALWDGGQAAVAASDDPMIRFVLAIEPVAQEVRQAYERRVAAPTGRAYERIHPVRYAVYGDQIYPDATFTPRITYGAVEGWSHQGRTVGAVTDIAGLYARATGRFPYELPARWLEAKEGLDLTAPLNLASSTDILGGNSGSPLINARGEAIGAVFDGNIHSLGGAYGYDAALNRTVSVSTVAITEALRKVYNQPALLQELGVR